MSAPILSRRAHLRQDPLLSVIVLEAHGRLQATHVILICKHLHRDPMLAGLFARIGEQTTRSRDWRKLQVVTCLYPDWQGCPVGLWFSVSLWDELMGVRPTVCAPLFWESSSWIPAPAGAQMMARLRCSCSDFTRRWGVVRPAPPRNLHSAWHVLPLISRAALLGKAVLMQPRGS